MKHAILIAAHRSPALLALEIDALTAAPRVHAFVHIDRGASFSPGDLLGSLATPERVTFVEPRHPVRWAAYSMLPVILRLLRTARSNGGHGFYHLLSGQCFPTRPIAEVLEAFESDRDREYLECFRLPNDRWAGGGLNRLQYYHLYDQLDVRKRVLRVPVNKAIVDGLVIAQRALRLRRPLPGEFDDYYGGSAFWSLTETAVDYALAYIDEHPEFTHGLRSTFCPDEILLQTVLANSPLADRITGDNRRYIDWTYRNGSMPANLDESDYDAIVGSDAMFARKFDIEHGMSLLERLQHRR